MDNRTQNIEKALIELMHQHDCVVLPEIGGLVASYRSGRFNSQKGVFLPPDKQFSLNQHLKHNDGLLINKLSELTNCDYPVAALEVETWTQSILKKLETSKSFDFQSIGKLYFEGVQLRFESSRASFLLSAFGLKPVRPLKQIVEDSDNVIQLNPQVEEIKVAEKQIEAMPSVAEPIAISRVRKVANWWVAAALIPLGFYSAWIPMKTNLLSGQGSFAYADLNPFTFDKYQPNYSSIIPIYASNDLIDYPSFDPVDSFYLQKAKHESHDVRETTEVHIDINEQAIEHQPILTVKNYHVIGGCFKDKENAGSFVDQLIKEGFEASIVDMNKGLHRVSLGAFSSKNEARALTKSLKKSGSYSTWVLKKK